MDSVSDPALVVHPAVNPLFSHAQELERRDAALAEARQQLQQMQTDLELAATEAGHAKAHIHRIPSVHSLRKSLRFILQ